MSTIKKPVPRAEKGTRDRWEEWGGHRVTLTGLLYQEFVGSGMSGVTLSHVANFFTPMCLAGTLFTKHVNRSRVGILWTLKSGGVQ